MAKQPKYSVGDFVLVANKKTIFKVHRVWDRRHSYDYHRYDLIGESFKSKDGHHAYISGVREFKLKALFAQ